MNSRTASPSQSIWRDLDENIFRTHLINLEERTNAVPVDPQLFLLPTDTDNSRKFSIDDEQKLADAFAFLVAVEQGAQSVAAVCLEENLEEQSLVVCFAAIDTIDEYLQESLGKICGTLAVNLLHRVQFLYTKKEKPQRKVVETEIEYLAKLYECFETVPAQSDDEVSSIENLVKASYGLCTSNSIKDYADRLETVGPTPQLRSAVKTLRQIEKIAAYYRVTQTLLRASQQYPYYFQHLELKYLPPYAGIPTDIGYEEWAKTCHVHAEVQLVVYYDLRQKGTPVGNLLPRVIGTSKYLCYLCYLFLKSHGCYPPANTHGRLYDQWTIPDLLDMEDDIRRKYREIVRLMDEEVVEKATEKPQWRSEPMTSRENLLDALGDSKSIALWRRATKSNSSTSLEF
ncbi:hypothetical protein TWF102_000847 [Orbilia oligospora]|uniref:Uncharacterized protein n=1 Tax=Orbilia oligospora TaxID=2813651 RepID=A0A7C8JAR2_ORBOL|nr:hypothetical protein TWF102_000847 [Orbilia oligospora]